MRLAHVTLPAGLFLAMAVGSHAAGPSTRANDGRHGAAVAELPVDSMAWSQQFGAAPEGAVREYALLTLTVDDGGPVYVRVTYVGHERSRTVFRLDVGTPIYLGGPIVSLDVQPATRRPTSVTFNSRLAAKPAEPGASFQNHFNVAVPH